MKNWWKICGAAAISLVWTSTGFAREAQLQVNIPADWSKENPTPVGFSIDGVAGVWIRNTTARRYLKLEVGLQACREELQLTQEKAANLGIETNLLQNRVALVEEERDVWKYKWTNENAQRVALEMDSRVWWKSRWLWLGVGAVLGGAATTKVVQEVR